jgi:hypothetical protein
MDQQLLTITSNFLQFQFTSLKCQTDLRASRVAKIKSGMKCVLTPSECRLERKKKKKDIGWRYSLAAPYRLL